MSLALVRSPLLRRVEVLLDKVTGAHHREQEVVRRMVLCHAHSSFPSIISSACLL